MMTFSSVLLVLFVRSLVKVVTGILLGTGRIQLLGLLAGVVLRIATSRPLALLRTAPKFLLGLSLLGG